MTQPWPYQYRYDPNEQPTTAATGTIDVPVRCPMCEANDVLRLDKKGYDAWKGGVPIQQALSTVPAQDRERLLTGICGPCWKNLWGNE